MRELLVVLNTRAQSFLKRAFELRWQIVLQNIASIVIFGGFAIAVFFVARMTTDYLINQAHIGVFLFHRFLSMLLFVFFITVNVGNMIVSFGTLYRSQEVGFLMALPISHAKIFLIKFVDNFFYSSSTLTLLGLALLLGYGSSFDMPWYFYFIVMFFVMLPLMLMAGVLAVTTLMLLIKLGSKIGFRWLLVMLLAFYAAVIYTYFSITNPMLLVQEVMKLWPNVNAYLGYLDPPFAKFLPNHWVAEFLYWSISGNISRALPYLALLIFSTLGLISLAALMAREYYYPGWLAVADMQAKNAGGNERGRGVLGLGTAGWLSPRLDVLIRRDFTLFFRDPSQWLHLLLMIVLLAMFLVSVSTLNLRFEHPVMQTNALLAVFLFNGFLVASIALRFVFPAISLEGETFWAVRSSPMVLRNLFWYKVLTALAVVLILAEIITMSSVHMFVRNGDVTLVAGGLMFFVVLALVSFNLAAGGYFAVYREKNPMRIASSQGASLTFLGSMIYLTMVAAVLVLPFNRYFQSMEFVGLPAVRWAEMPLMIVGVLSLMIFAMATSVGLRSMRKDN